MTLVILSYYVKCHSSLPPLKTSFLPSFTSLGPQTGYKTFFCNALTLLSSRDVLRPCDLEVSTMFFLWTVLEDVLSLVFNICVLWLL